MREAVFFTLGICGGALLLCAVLIYTHATYKDGQIDALSGKEIHYHLVAKPDSTRTWELIK